MDEKINECKDKQKNKKFVAMFILRSDDWKLVERSLNDRKGIGILFIPFLSILKM